jgi:hypothetical protein
MATILPFVAGSKKGWSQAEEAEFLRATEILRGTGLPVVTESGISDEGDPWTIFLREDTGDVVVHISKIDGYVVAASAASEDVVSGPSFRAVMNRIIRSQPLVLPTTRSADTVYLHPSAIITAFIATALVWSFNEETNVQQYDWRIADDGSIQPSATTPRAAQSASILRDAILSKGEACINAHEAGTLSNRFVMAASVAAVAIVAELGIKPSATDDANFATSDEPLNGEQTVAAATFNPGSGNSEEAAETGAHAMLTPLQSLGSDPVSVVEDGTIIGHVVDRTAQGSTYLEIDSANGYAATHNVGMDRNPIFDDLAYSRVHVADPSAHVSDPSAPDGSTSDVAQEAIEPVAIEKPASTSGGLPSSSWAKSWEDQIIFSADAAELLLMLFSSREVDSPPSAPDIALAYDVQFDGIDVSGNGEKAEALKAPVETQSSTDRGYKLVGDILAFAFDDSKELTPSPVVLENLANALKANSFLPSADRIVVIDAPDLRADAFRFTDGIVMISQELAARLLPGVPLQPQSEISLASGASLKLIGVIEMFPDPSSYIV